MFIMANMFVHVGHAVHKGELLARGELCHVPIVWEGVVIFVQLVAVAIGLWSIAIIVTMAIARDKLRSDALTVLGEVRSSVRVRNATAEKFHVLHVMVRVGLLSNNCKRRFDGQHCYSRS